MDDVLYAVEIWLLFAALLAWFFSRAAMRLRQPPSSRAELLLAVQHHADELWPLGASLSDRDPVWRAVRVYERA
jgi:hypothetical protein